MALKLTIGWTVLVAMLAIRDGIRIWRHFRKESPGPRWLLSLLPLLAALLLLMLWLRIGVSAFNEWNGARTAPAIALAKGIPIYYSKGEGPAAAFIHGPVSAIVRLPAALAKTPTMAVLIAAVINAALFHLPAVALVLAIPRSRPLMRGLGLLVFLGFALNLPSLLYSGTLVHADAPAVGFGLLACACLTDAGRLQRRALMLCLAATCAVLSAASKQNLAPILLVLPVYALVRFGWREAGIITLAESGALAIVAGLSILVFGYEPLYYTMFIIAMKHLQFMEKYGKPWQPAYGTVYLISDMAAPALAFVIALLLDANRPKSRWAGLRMWTFRNPWVLPFGIAMVMVPSSIIGRIKPGGAENALTPTTYFLVAALMTWIAAYRPRPAESWSAPLNRFTVSATAALCMALAILSATPLQNFVNFWEKMRTFWQNPQQIAYEFSLEHPQQAYFPWEPLSTLMSDGRYYIFDYGAVDLFMAGDFMTAERVKKFVPPKMEYLVYPSDLESSAMRGWLPDFSKPGSAPGLNGWSVYTRP